MTLSWHLLASVGICWLKLAKNVYTNNTRMLNTHVKIVQENVL
jgi:hypothetical protein